MAEGTYTERFTIDVEYRVWPGSDLDRETILASLIEPIPTVIPDADGDEGATVLELKEADVVPEDVAAYCEQRAAEEVSRPEPTAKMAGTVYSQLARVLRGEESLPASRS